MKLGFYPKLALDGIRKNKKMYIPYILTCIGMVMMYYIIVFLSRCETVQHLHGSNAILLMMELGGWVIAAFSCVFLFYTNSFLIRRRKKEFGLYNMLGMGKRHIGIILFWETFFIAAISLIIGLTAGIAFSKLAELGLVNILQGEISYNLYISFPTIYMTAAVFGVIFLLLFLNTLRQIRFSSAIALIRSENFGEKPPKANWLLGILGAVVLAVAYCLAVIIDNPLDALLMFFVAVIMVIGATYLLMIAGSVLICRILQKNKKYYYNSKHFVSLSSMVYRMKRNGAGLASICILATMVLVIVSSTTSLYFGSEDSLQSRYTREINIDATMNTIEQLSDEYLNPYRNAAIDIAKDYDTRISNVQDSRYADVAGFISGNEVICDKNKLDETFSYSDVRDFFFLSLDDYNKITEGNLTLAADEAFLLTYRCSYPHDTISFNDKKTFKVKSSEYGIIDGLGTPQVNLVASITVIVPDLEDAMSCFKIDDGSYDLVNFVWNFRFDTGLDEDGQISLGSTLDDKINDIFASSTTGYSMRYTLSSREAERADYFGLNSGFFYIGIMLSIVFIFAAVLIIYYKQISEGYEDQSRFEIMQKVGMTKKEIRKSINSQLLTVFFLPLLGAGLHLAFAFPMINKLLMLFNLYNVNLFVKTSVVSFLIFALFYTLVYRITSNAYYNIVSKAKGK